MLPITEPATANHAANIEFCGRAAAINSSSKSVPPGLGMPADSTIASTNTPSGPQDFKTSRKSCIRYLNRVPNHSEKPGFVDNLNAQLSRFVELRSGFFPRHYEAGFLANRPRHLAVGGLDALLGLFTRQGRQRSRQYEGDALQRPPGPLLN